MSDDKSLEEKVAALPPAPRAFVEGYGEGTVGWVPTPRRGEDKPPSGFSAKEGYDFNLSAATNRVCQRCGAVVANTDLHDKFHNRIEPKESE